MSSSNIKVLIVEDEFLHYDTLSNYLKEKNFIVDEYTKSYDEAIQRIKRRKPDIVLLDIQLMGEKTGIDLAKIIYEEYDIPFIYISSYTDVETYLIAKETTPVRFVKKTKPFLDLDDLVRTIETAITWITKFTGKEQNLTNETNKKASLPLDIKPRKAQRKEVKHATSGLFVLKDRISKVKDLTEEIVEVPLAFNDILFFSTQKIWAVKSGVKKEKYKNYVWLLDIHGDVYYYRSSLGDLNTILPVNFIRIGESYIVNFSLEFFRGKDGRSQLLMEYPEEILNFLPETRYKYPKKKSARMLAFRAGSGYKNGLQQKLQILFGKLYT